MKKSELIELVMKYREWDDELDETACRTGFVSCPICDGGGTYRKQRRRRGDNQLLPAHNPGCPRLKFNQDHCQ